MIGQPHPDAVNFPRRNRIISGMTLGTVVVETGITGGAMITASFALQQNREVFAVPGPVTDEPERGTHLLIKEGRAKLAESLDDILSELEPGMIRSLKEAAPEPAPQLALFEQKIFDVLRAEPTHVDAITDLSGMSTADVLVELLKLEFKGLIRQLPGKMFRRT